MKENRERFYKCKENDNSIRLYLDEDNGKLDEIQVGCKYLPQDGYSVIGIKDLTEALRMIGYSITQDKKEDKTDIIRISKWEELDGVKNDNYQITVDLVPNDLFNSFEIRHFSNCTIISKVCFNNTTKETVLAWLSMFGFSVEFTAPRRLSKADWHMAQALYAMYPNGWVVRGDKPDKELVFYEGIPTKGRVDWIYESGSFWHLAIGLFPFIIFSDTEPYSTADLAKLEMEEQDA